MDKTYVGGAEKGVRAGRSASKKGITVAAVEVLPKGKLGGARMKVMAHVKGASLIPFMKENVDSDANVADDGWPTFNQLSGEGHRHERHVCKGPQASPSRPILHAVYLLMSNLKVWLSRRFHVVSRKYLPVYMVEFMYRINPQRPRPDLFGWVARRLMSRDLLTL